MRQLRMIGNGDLSLDAAEVAAPACWPSLMVHGDHGWGLAALRRKAPGLCLIHPNGAVSVFFTRAAVLPRAPERRGDRVFHILRWSEGHATSR